MLLHFSVRFIILLQSQQPKSVITVETHTYTHAYLFTLHHSAQSHISTDSFYIKRPNFCLLQPSDQISKSNPLLTCHRKQQHVWVLCHSGPCVAWFVTAHIFPLASMLAQQFSTRLGRTVTQHYRNVNSHRKKLF